MLAARVRDVCAALLYQRQLPVSRRPGTVPASRHVLGMPAYVAISDRICIKCRLCHAKY